MERDTFGNVMSETDRTTVEHFEEFQVPHDKYAHSIVSRECPQCGKRMQDMRISDGLVVHSVAKCESCGIVMVPRDLGVDLLDTMPANAMQCYRQIAEVSDEELNHLIAGGKCPNCSQHLRSRIRKGVNYWECVNCNFVASHDKLPDDYEGITSSLARGLCPRCGKPADRVLLATDDNLYMSTYACKPCDRLYVFDTVGADETI